MFKLSHKLFGQERCIVSRPIHEGEVCLFVRPDTEIQHGVGVEKRDLMPEMFSDVDLVQQITVKCAFDGKAAFDWLRAVPLGSPLLDALVRSLSQRQRRAQIVAMHRDEALRCQIA
jgi:hypothetical protein